jgi:hypothetical protein
MPKIKSLFTARMLTGFRKFKFKSPSLLARIYAASYTNVKQLLYFLPCLPYCREITPPGHNEYFAGGPGKPSSTLKTRKKAEKS